MSREIELAQPRPAEMMQFVEASPEPERAPVNVFAAMHSLLRGRYVYVVILAVIGTAVGGFFGYRLAKPKYVSNGLIRIKPNLQKVLYSDEQNGVMPMFDAFVDSQIALIHSQRVVDLAMQNHDWQALQRGLSPDAVAQFNTNLVVDHPRGSELITVDFTDTDPQAAMIAVRSVIEAYQKLYGENDTDDGSQRLQVLEDRRIGLTNELDGIKGRILAIANEFGSDSLSKIYEFKVDELNKLESQLKDAQIALATAEGVEAKDAATTQPSVSVASSVKQSVKPSAEEIGQVVPQVADLLQKRRELQRQLKVKIAQVGEKHPSVIDAKVQIAAYDDEIAQATSSFTREELDSITRGQSFGKQAPVSLGHLRATTQNVTALYNQAKSETVDLGRKNLTITDLRSQAEVLQTRLDETKARIEQLNVEATVSGRVSIISSGDRPLSPIIDKRKAFAGAGAAGMAGLGVGFVLLLGLLDRRVRHISDAQNGFCRPYRVLGVMPMIPMDLSDPEDAAAASHGVHQIRAALQHDEEHHGVKTFTVTSASPGAGKTSLVAALGLSFANSGSRTLLIDCDIIGGGLSSMMNRVIRRKIGQILRREGLLDDQQVKQILEQSTKQKERFGAAAVNMGILTEADIEHAVSVQKDAVVGLREVLDGEPLQDCITGTGTPDLFLLPLGSAMRKHVGQLSLKAITAMLVQAGGQFDTVLIDTGPILGSLEASMVAMAADRVVVVVSRGEQRPLAERAIEQLRASDAKIAGVVFNRAQPTDMITSGYSSSLSRSNIREDSANPANVGDIILRYGPLGTAVASTGDISEKEKNS